eukprot:gnl/Chilomastix_cuspidata/1539.p1 GENE.gnl/Chilomastix_cuspidata/1539~~gnl/Chilomastix_cuspidata/1539.p1  ORF type:complete len:772 (-),score=72.24 gnl/Chilomastix_cuspidata/1539:189-2504(-)
MSLPSLPQFCNFNQLFFLEISSERRAKNPKLTYICVKKVAEQTATDTLKPFIEFLIKPINFEAIPNIIPPNSNCGIRYLCFNYLCLLTSEGKCMKTLNDRFRSLLRRRPTSRKDGGLTIAAIIYKPDEIRERLSRPRESEEAATVRTPTPSLIIFFDATQLLAAILSGGPIGEFPLVRGNDAAIKLALGEGRRRSVLEGPPLFGGSKLCLFNMVQALSSKGPYGTPLASVEPLLRGLLRKAQNKRSEAHRRVRCFKGTKRDFGTFIEEPMLLEMHTRMLSDGTVHEGGLADCVPRRRSPKVDESLDKLPEVMVEVMAKVMAKAMVKPNRNGTHKVIANSLANGVSLKIVSQLVETMLVKQDVLSNFGFVRFVEMVANASGPFLDAVGPAITEACGKVSGEVEGLIMQQILQAKKQNTKDIKQPLQEAMKNPPGQFTPTVKAMAERIEKACEEASGNKEDAHERLVEWLLKYDGILLKVRPSRVFLQPPTENSSREYRDFYASFDARLGVEYIYMRPDFLSSELALPYASRGEMRGWWKTDKPFCKKLQRELEGFLRGKGWDTGASKQISEKVVGTVAEIGGGASRYDDVCGILRDKVKLEGFQRKTKDFIATVWPRDKRIVSEVYRAVEDALKTWFPEICRAEDIPLHRFVLNFPNAPGPDALLITIGRRGDEFFPLIIAFDIKMSTKQSKGTNFAMQLGSQCTKAYGCLPKPTVLFSVRVRPSHELEDLQRKSVSLGAAFGMDHHVIGEEAFGPALASLITSTAEKLSNT